MIRKAMSRSLRELYESSPFASVQAPYVEEQYERYLSDPASVSAEWRDFFGPFGPPAAAPAVSRALPDPGRPSTAAPAHPVPTTDVEKQSSVSRLIQFYANRGHLIADIDPLGLMQRPMPKVLDPAYVGLTEADMDTEFHTASRTSGVDKHMKLSLILKQLRQIYTGRIGAEFAHVSTSEERLWLQDRFQDGRLHHRFSNDERLNFLWQLSAAEGLERYLHTRYVGQKRFSLEGGEALIPLLDDVVQQERRRRHRGNRHRHGAPRAPERAGERPRQVAGRCCSRNSRASRGRRRRGLRRRQVPQGLLRGPAHGTGQRARRACLQSLAPRDRGRGGGGLGARAPGTARRQHGRHHIAAPDPRRCRVRGPGRRDRNDAALAGAKFRDRRDPAPRHQQPDRLHHQRSARRALDAVLQRRRQDDRGADLPRERGRPGGGRIRLAPGARLPHGVPEGRGHRPGLLSPPRPQRGGRAGRDAADHVPGDPQARDRAPDLRPAPRAGRPDRRGPGRRDARGLPARARGAPASGAGVRGHDSATSSRWTGVVTSTPTGPSRSRRRSTASAWTRSRARSRIRPQASRCTRESPGSWAIARACTPTSCPSTGARPRRWPTRRC